MRLFAGRLLVRLTARLAAGNARQREALDQRGARMIRIHHRSPAGGRTRGCAMRRVVSFRRNLRQDGTTRWRWMTGVEEAHRDHHASSDPTSHLPSIRRSSAPS